MVEKPLPQDGTLQTRPCGLRDKGRNGGQTFPQNSVLCIQPCCLTIPAQVKFPLEKKGKVGAYGGRWIVLALPGGSSPGVSAPGPASYR